MPTYIEKEALYKRITEKCINQMEQAPHDRYDRVAMAYADCGSMVQSTPPADIAIIQHGQWITVNDYVNIGNGTHMECSIFVYGNKTEIRQGFVLTVVLK